MVEAEVLLLESGVVAEVGEVELGEDVLHGEEAV